MSISGVRTRRNAAILFVDRNGFEVSIGDQVLIETDDGLSLAVVSVNPEQILVPPDRPIRSRIVAGVGSPDVAAALRDRNRATLALVRADLEPRVHVVDVEWSPDLG